MSRFCSKSHSRVQKNLVPAKLCCFIPPKNIASPSPPSESHPYILKTWFSFSPSNGLGYKQLLCLGCRLESSVGDGKEKGEGRGKKEQRELSWAWCVFCGEENSNKTCHFWASWGVNSLGMPHSLVLSAALALCGSKGWEIIIFCYKVAGSLNAYSCICVCVYIHMCALYMCEIDLCCPHF